MIFVDSNIPMYCIGQNHPLKLRAELLTEDLIRRGERLVTSAEVMQEILHRFTAIRKPEMIQPALDALSILVDDIFSISQEHILGARDLLLRHRNLSSRDAVHASVMKSLSIERILSFDSGFDSIPGIERIH